MLLLRPCARPCAGRIAGAGFYVRSPVVKLIRRPPTALRLLLLLLLLAALRSSPPAALAAPLAAPRTLSARVWRGGSMAEPSILPAHRSGSIRSGRDDLHRSRHSAAAGGGGFFPELRDPSVSARPNAGLAFSGGGLRSYVASLGYLRALIEAGLLPHARYIGGVSGGSWATVRSSWLRSILESVHID
eukprot:COSAG01_NODE_4075_length_5381_cov_2.647103_7_plen_188_part_00